MSIPLSQGYQAYSLQSNSIQPAELVVAREFGGGGGKKERGMDSGGQNPPTNLGPQSPIGHCVWWWSTPLPLALSQLLLAQ